MNPSDFLAAVHHQAQGLHKKIVLPDSTDPRTLRAARIIKDKAIALPILVGSIRQITSLAATEKVMIDDIAVVDPETSGESETFTEKYYNLRKSKGMQLSEAKEIMKRSLFYGAMMVREGLADGSVAGSLSTTGDVMRAGLHIIGMPEGIGIVSSFFIMIFPTRIFSFSDCAVVPDPTAEQLADIALTTAANHKKLIGEDPFVAMLSFSTKGSATHPLVEKVQKATEIARTKNPSLKIDGDLQLDAAIVPKIGQQKAPGSPVAGNANVLIFPDLNAGNIGYKLAQRLGGAEAVGPVVQGLRRPFFDLSRGCSVDDIVNTVAINVVIGAV